MSTVKDPSQDAAANQAYGALTEGLYIARYTLERAFHVHLEPLIEGDAWRECGAGFDDINAFMDSLRLDQFRGIASERKKIVNRIRELQPDVSNRQIARTLGVDHVTVGRDLAGENSPEGGKNANEANAAEDWGGENSPDGKPYRTLGTGNNEWQTPVDVIERARRALGDIDLDPASSPSAQERVRAARFHTVEDDGLIQPWHGRVWLNPPYMQPEIEQFVDRLLEELGVGRTTAAIMLTHNSTDTAWFHKAERVAPLICFTRGRIPFESPTKDRAAPVQGQAIFYFGGFGDRFTSEFAEIGFIR